QRVVDLVSDGRGQPPRSRELLRAPHGLLLAVPICDIGANSHHAYRRTLFIHDDSAMPAYPADFAVGKQNPEFDVVLLFGFQGLLDAFLYSLQILGINGLEPGFQPAVKLLRSQAVDTGDLIRPDEIISLDIPVPGSHLRGLMGDCQAVNHGAKGLFVLLCLRNVLKEDTNSVGERMSTHLEPTCAICDGSLELHLYALRSAPKVLLLRRGAHQIGKERPEV